LDGVRISWTQFPQELGNFGSYQLHKEYYDHQSDTATNSQIEEVFTLLNISDTTFLDTQTRRFEHYNYWVEAIFEEGDLAGSSQVTYIELVDSLSGSLFGVISDTINGFVVNDFISVPQNNNLIINPGVEFAFSDKAVFNVHGGLQVNGTEEQMVEFHANHYQNFDSLEVQK
ncbi:MAG: hypothetical protein GY808_04620, partial [Gammaproteobacteria bacterium]|nr:hypothetical protein [Gammaproteobacteria bacterium]